MSLPQSITKYPFPQDIAASLQNLLSLTGYSSEDDVLRLALARLLEDHAEEEDEWRETEKAIEELQQGVPCIPLDEAFADLRKQLNLPPQ